MGTNGLIVEAQVGIAIVSMQMQVLVSLRVDKKLFKLGLKRSPAQETEGKVRQTTTETGSLKSSGKLLFLTLFEQSSASLGSQAPIGSL